MFLEPDPTRIIDLDPDTDFGSRSGWLYIIRIRFSPLNRIRIRFSPVTRIRIRIIWGLSTLDTDHDDGAPVVGGHDLHDIHRARQDTVPQAHQQPTQTFFYTWYNETYISKSFFYFEPWGKSFDHLKLLQANTCIPWTELWYYGTIFHIIRLKTIRLCLILTFSFLWLAFR